MLGLRGRRDDTAVAGRALSSRRRLAARVAVAPGTYGSQSPGGRLGGAGPSMGGPAQTSRRPHDRSTRNPSPCDPLGVFWTSPSLTVIDPRTRPVDVRASTCHGRGGRSCPRMSVVPEWAGYVPDAFPFTKRVTAKAVPFDIDRFGTIADADGPGVAAPGLAPEVDAHPARTISAASAASAKAHLSCRPPVTARLSARADRCRALRLAHRRHRLP
jgi:hypothetical protein